MQIDYSNKQVLLIESSGVMRSAIVYMLRDLGVMNLKAITINDRVLVEITENNYDVIMLGHNSHDNVTGIQLLEECRYKGYIKHSACWVFMSGDSSQEIVLHAIDSNPDAMLTKPFSVDELKHRLDSVLARKEAFRPVDKALEIDDYAAAINYCKLNFTSSDPAYDAAQLILAQTLVAYSKFSEAVQVAEKLYWKSHDKEAKFIWARAELELERYQEAERLLQELIAEMPLFMAAYDLLAEVKEREGDFNKARDVIHEATQKSPLGIPRQMNLGRLATQTQAFDVADGAYKKSIALGRDSCYRSAEPYLKLANVKRLEIEHSEDEDTLSQQNEFEKIINQASRAFPKDKTLAVKAALLRSELYTQLDDLDSANRHTRLAQLANESLEEPLNLEKELSAVTGKPTAVDSAQSGEASAAKTSVKERNPDMSHKMNRLGVQHYLSGKMPQALKHFGLATEYDTSNVGALLNLAQLFLESARDSAERREERMRMVGRYLDLAEKLQTEDEHKAKLGELKAFFDNGAEHLPEGSLGALMP